MIGRLTFSLICAAAFGLDASQPQPFPRPGQSGTAERPPVRKPTSTPHDPSQPPSEATLGLPIYPGAVFLASYDAGRGQRFYLFGTNAGFAELVTYYKTFLKQKGDEVFDAPATHMFEVGKFNEQTMAFPPGVTIKDYTWGGSAGYPNPRRGAEPARFRTVIQIVPPATAQSAR